MIFFQELQQRNKWLYFFGCFAMVVGIIILGFLLFDTRTYNGISLWILPFRFSIGSGIYIFSITWFSYLINNTNYRKAISFFIFLIFSCFLGIVITQLIKENIAFLSLETPFDLFMNQLGIVLLSSLLILQIWITSIFVRQKKNMHSQHYTWGVRMGFIVFTFFLSVVFTILLCKGKTVYLDIFQFHRGLSFEIQTAFYLGLHSIQIIPFLSYYLFDKKKQVVFFSVSYLSLILILITSFLLKFF